MEPTSPLSVPVYQILLSLSDRVLHGYAILLDVSERTDGEVQIAAGTLYAAVDRLLRSGWIEELDEAPGDQGHDERRRYYSITGDGLERLQQEAKRMHRAVQMAADKRLIRRPAAGGRQV